jgi:peptidoglycan-N-acetylglucosamine deacetylase
MGTISEYYSVLLMILDRIRRSVMFRILRVFATKRLPAKSKVIYLTFDDGPEPEITEFVLCTLKKYNARATFFCTGKNIEKHPELLKLIDDEGNAIGNHTYSHIDAFQVNFCEYVNDIEKCNALVKSNLFRPPWGALTIRELLCLLRKYRIVLWDVSSFDMKKVLDADKVIDNMTRRSRPGSIVLFHFSSQHASGTMKILDRYMGEMAARGFEFGSIQL